MSPQCGCIEPADRKEKEVHLRRVNDHLGRHSFLAGEALTAADVLLYHGLHGLVADMTFHDKDRLVHLSRWFRHLQQDAKLRRGKSLVTFSRSKLY